MKRNGLPRFWTCDRACVFWSSAAPVAGSLFGQITGCDIALVDLPFTRDCELLPKDVKDCTPGLAGILVPMPQPYPFRRWQLRCRQSE